MARGKKVHAQTVRIFRVFAELLRFKIFTDLVEEELFCIRVILLIILVISRAAAHTISALAQPTLRLNNPWLVTTETTSASASLLLGLAK